MEKAPGPSSRLAPPSLTPSQPALQATVQWECLTHHFQPVVGPQTTNQEGGGGGEPPFTEVAQAPALRPEHLEKWVTDAGPAASS